MCRVKAVVGRAIMVRLEDVVPGDIVSVRDTEADPIVESIEFDGRCYRLNYKPRGVEWATSTHWLDPEHGGHIFVHDLRNERAEYVP